MHNFLVFTIAMNVQSGLFSNEEGEKLAKELESVTLPDNYADAATIVKRLYTKLEIKPITPAK